MITRYILIAILFTSCINAKKATHYMRDHKDISSKVCAELYPVKADSSVSYTIDTSAYEDALMEMTYVIDSLINNCHDAEGRIIVKDSLIHIRDSIIRTVVRVKPCKDSVKTIIIKEENTAALMACSAQLSAEHDHRIKAETARDLYKGQKKNYFWIMIILAVALGISIFFHAKKMFVK